MTQSRNKAIFLSYEGHGQSYLEALYLPILKSIENPPIDFTVVHFIPKDHPQKATDAAAAQRLGVRLHFLNNYHNAPQLLSTLFCILNGILKVNSIAAREKIDFIHARGLIPGLITLCVTFFRRKIKTIFDPDGFVPEFRVETGLLNEQSFMFKALKKIEKRLVEKSDLILARSQNARKIMSDWYGAEAEAKIYVTPNGKDENCYRPFSPEENRKIRQKYGLSQDAIFVIYVGSMSENFLPDKMFRLFSGVKKLEPNSFFLLLSGTDFEPLDEMARAEGLTETDYTVERVFPSEVPAFISAADVGFSFRTPTLSNLGVSPLKVCEYLLCGTPAVVNSGTGDLESLFETNEGLGFLLKETSDEELNQAAEWVVRTAKPKRECFRETARRGGIEEFGLSRIKKLYENVYSKLIN
ncbi:MAG: glycosyltransferase [Acidobacteriota bacterium]|nr:glycosyltransferase [Acidobacteriota bacterium]